MPTLGFKDGFSSWQMWLAYDLISSEMEIKVNNKKPHKPDFSPS